MTQAEKNKLFDAFNSMHPTVSGMAATLCGRLEKFPKIESLLGSIEISWEAIAKRCESGNVRFGDFR